ncbi:Uncharacterised protein [Ectopseudomonas mendocina]|nr:Uncharacterised protein [Pseudomonas mendocina]
MCGMSYKQLKVLRLGPSPSSGYWKFEEYSSMRGLIVMTLAFWLGGCSFSAPGVHARVGDPDVIRVDLGGHGHSNGGSFCPPGHRMKGSC